MTREMILQFAGLDETELWGNAKIDLRNDQDALKVIDHLYTQIPAAIKLVEGFCGNDDLKLMRLF
ncbi:hypothetical protein HDV04_001266 [Boothiomyces sp. JEL0838]|nr:hypothetical protein HDV04_001266 [Boothiomyces sp. JEL0838]